MTRSEMMSRVRPKDTKPEITVRSALHRAGLRFRLHRRDLPGTPDIVLPKHGIAVMVNGCFWHGHSCGRSRVPKTNVEFWRSKITRNIERDERVLGELHDLGWRCVVVWECKIDDGIRQVIGMAE
jgi:DNA mismatch endonuclease (patch repair protein)